MGKFNQQNKRISEIFHRITIGVYFFKGINDTTREN